MVAKKSNEAKMDEQHSQMTVDLIVNEPTTLTELVEFARKHGLKSIKKGDIHIELGQLPVQPQSQPPQKKLTPEEIKEEAIKRQALITYFSAL